MTDNLNWPEFFIYALQTLRLSVQSKWLTRQRTSIIRTPPKLRLCLYMRSFFNCTGITSICKEIWNAAASVTCVPLPLSSIVGAAAMYRKRSSSHQAACTGVEELPFAAKRSQVVQHILNNMQLLMTYKCVFKLVRGISSRISAYLIRSVKEAIRWTRELVRWSYDIHPMAQKCRESAKVAGRRPSALRTMQIGSCSSGTVSDAVFNGLII